MRTFLPFLLLLFLISCSSGKKLSYEEMMEGAPQWVKQSPNTPGYFHGVGMASKSGSPDDYRSIAMQNALSELASGISVNISSSSVLNQYEFENNYSEYYRDNIQMSTQEYLEGYELVDSWENERQYWVYYRLSKSKYNEIKQQRINKALNTSKANFSQARTFSDKGNVFDAMRFYVKSIEDVKDFLGEDLTTDIDGKSEGYSSLLLSEIVSTVQNLRIIFPVEKLEYTRGKGASLETLSLLVKDEHDVAVKGIPVFTKFSYAPGKKIEKVSDANGAFRIQIENFDSRKSDEYIASSVDVAKIVNENTADPVIRRLLQSIKIPEYVLHIEVVSPKFFIRASEKNLGSEVTTGVVAQEFGNLLKGDGIEIVSDESKSDYILSAEVNTEKSSEVNNRFSSALTATFNLKNKQGQTIFSDNLSGISGLGKNFAEAGEDAYRSLSGKIRINVYPAMYKKVFDASR